MRQETSEKALDKGARKKCLFFRVRFGQTLILKERILSHPEGNFSSTEGLHILRPAGGSEHLPVTLKRYLEELHSMGAQSSFFPKMMRCFLESDGDRCQKEGGAEESTKNPGKSEGKAKRDENSRLEMLEGAKSMGAGAATIASAGAAVGIGNVFSSLIHSVARNPSLAKQSFGYAILGFALTEAIASFAQ
ncbi:hypothetical protein IEQ34_024373 [Dendrobium chrysotoxum]|uniref:ATP synthase subunit 9, mitochondrial n=1 Tax=Dendrobium chrysotoxum TaxID=161865 RepID=A0AAV7FT20_DENCH|nr:hypothetical protein IEQ34_024373 [Dendrobium chrysotoxum]